MAHTDNPPTLRPPSRFFLHSTTTGQLRPLYANAPIPSPNAKHIVTAISCIYERTESKRRRNREQVPLWKKSVAHGRFPRARHPYYIMHSYQHKKKHSVGQIRVMCGTWNAKPLFTFPLWIWLSSNQPLTRSQGLLDWLTLYTKTYMYEALLRHSRQRYPIYCDVVPESQIKHCSNYM